MPKELIRMATRRRWFQYSLRSFLVVLTALAVWLGVVVRRATEQREAVKAIEAIGGVVVYDWQPMLTRKDAEKRITRKKVGVAPGRATVVGPAWLRRQIDDDFFQEIKEVYLLPSASRVDQEVLKLMPCLERLRGLQYLTVSSPLSMATQKELEAKLPNCEVYVLSLDR
jgi:hypothetical protein